MDINIYVYYFNNQDIKRKEKMSENNLITYQIKNIDKDVWNKFKSSVYGRGFDTIDSCLKAFIRDYSEGKCKVER